MAPATKRRSRKFGYIILLLLVIPGLILYKVFGPNTGIFTTGEYLYIRTGSNYEKLKATLEEGGFVADMLSFDLLAKQAKLPEHIHAGKYRVKRGMSNYNIIRMLRSGRQTPVKLVINKVRTKQEFTRLVSQNLEADSAELRQMLQDPVYAAQFGLDTNTVMCAVIPDTYEFYWNTNADKAFRKIQKNYARYWDAPRQQQAKNQGLTPVQAIIVASIVDEETNMTDDKPKIASVYLNRIKKGMKLQADPTVKFAIGDFAIRRVTERMLQTNSLYNTYMYTGLPPGPICTPAISTVEAVLQAPKTTYLYFCAKEDFSGYSNFATTWEEQIKNARAYRKALDARGIH